MAQVFSPPVEVGDAPNDFRGDWQKEEAAYLEKLREWCLKHGKGPNRGEIIKFPAGDGYAQYMVHTNTMLIHIPLGDAWQIPAAHARGLRATDIAEMVKREKAMAKLFSR